MCRFCNWVPIHKSSIPIAMWVSFTMHRVLSEFSPWASTMLAISLATNNSTPSLGPSRGALHCVLFPWKLTISHQSLGLPPWDPTMLVISLAAHHITPVPGFGPWDPTSRVIPLAAHLITPVPGFAPWDPTMLFISLASHHITPVLVFSPWTLYGVLANHHATLTW